MIGANRGGGYFTVQSDNQTAAKDCPWNVPVAGTPIVRVRGFAARAVHYLRIQGHDAHRAGRGRRLPTDAPAARQPEGAAERTGIDRDAHALGAELDDVQGEVRDALSLGTRQQLLAPSAASAGGLLDTEGPPSLMLRFSGLVHRACF